MPDNLFQFWHIPILIFGIFASQLTLDISRWFTLLVHLTESCCWIDSNWHIICIFVSDQQVWEIEAIICCCTGSVLVYKLTSSVMHAIPWLLNAASYRLIQILHSMKCISKCTGICGLDRRSRTMRNIISSIWHDHEPGLECKKLNRYDTSEPNYYAHGCLCYWLLWPLHRCPCYNVYTALPALLHSMLQLGVIGGMGVCPGTVAPGLHLNLFNTEHTFMFHRRLSIAHQTRLLEFWH